MKSQCRSQKKDKFVLIKLLLTVRRLLAALQIDQMTLAWLGEICALNDESGSGG
jgi:hypothetical protein